MVAAGLIGAAPTASAVWTPKMTVAFSAARITVGEYLTVSGTRTPALAGQPLTLQRQSAPGRWESLASTRPDAAGKYSLRYRLTTPGTNVLRMLSPKVGKTQNAASSPTGSVTVFRWIRLSDFTDASCTYSCPNVAAQVNGVTYSKTVTYSLWEGRQKAEWWNLSRKCSRLVSIVGQDDSDSAAVTFTAGVSADSADLWSGSTSLGHPASVDVDVSGYLRLTLSAANPSQSSDGHLTWADARVLCAK